MMQGPLLAALSALLLGISPVLCKLVIGEMSPILLAGLLYLGFEMWSENQMKEVCSGLRRGYTNVDSQGEAD